MAELWAGHLPGSMAGTTLQRRDGGEPNQRVHIDVTVGCLGAGAQFLFFWPGGSLSF